MSELKAFDVGLGQYCEDGTPCVIAFDADRSPRLLNEQVYLKSEADDVIAEKDAEIVELKKQVHDYTLGLFVIQATAEKEARHHKYKRCEAMVNLCDLKECYLYARALRTYKRSEMDYFEKKSEFYHKWYKKWLELLAKFKEMAK